MPTNRTPHLQHGDGCRFHRVTRWLACGLLLLAGCQRTPAEPTVNRVDGWRGDLAQLGSEALRLHPLLAQPGDTRTAFLARLDSLGNAVASLSDEDVGVRLQRILVAIGDGHTTIIPDDVGPVAFLALRTDFYWFDDGVHVVSVRPGMGAVRFARVTAIGGIPIDDVRARIAAYTPSDNPQSARWLGAQLMQYPVLLRAIGARSTDAATSLDVVDVNGQSLSVPVGAQVAAALPRLLPPNPGSPETPRYLRNLDKAFWVDLIDSDSLLYVGFNAVQDDPSETLAASAARLDALLTSGRYRSTVVDVRLNSGGNNRLLTPLIDVLRSFESRRAGNRLFVIIGRATFSAAQNFVTRLERATGAIFIGEPTGSRPNHIGDINEIRLPFSQLRVSVASTLYVDSTPDDPRPWIEPDVRVPVLSGDYFGNRDPAWDSVLVRVRSKG